MSLKDLFNNNGLKKTKSDSERLPVTGYADPDRITGDLVMMNNGVEICALACSSCWDTKLPDQYADKSSYIGRRAKTGHTSILEHSNVVFYFFVPDKFSDDLTEVLGYKNYLHSVVHRGINNAGWHVLLGGSWRGFSDLYLNAYTISDNAMMRAITSMVHQYIPSDAMTDLIEAGVLHKEDFLDTPDMESIKKFNACTYTNIDDDIRIISADSYMALIYELAERCSEPQVFTLKDIMRFLTVTVEYKHMSRIITQQLTRHRNGITQESQRYVDYSGAPFNSPAKFKPDKYDPKYMYDIDFGNKHFRMNLQQLGDEMNKIYPQLKDKKNGSNALISEDARAYLVQNTQCGRIYITFNFYHLIKYLQLREDSHAQSEMREYGLKIGKWFRENLFTMGRIQPDGMVEYPDDAIYDILIPTVVNNTRANKPIINTDSTNIITDENEVAETVSQEELVNLGIKTIEDDDAAGREPEGGIELPDPKTKSEL